MVGKTPTRTRLGAALGALLLAVLPVRAFAQIASDDELYIFPLPSVATEIDIADPTEWRQMAGGGAVQPGDNYSFSLVSVSAPNGFFNQGVPGFPATYDILEYSGTVEFLSRPAGVSDSVEEYLFLLLGFGQTPAEPSDGIAGYEKIEFFIDGVQTTPVDVSDLSGVGQIPGGFGDLFIGFVLAADVADPVDFDFTVAVREPLVNGGATFTFFNTAFMQLIQLPEPSAGLLLGLSLLALAGLRARPS